MEKYIGLLGKNGAGKTTLIKLINDLLVPSSGEVLFENQKIGAYSKEKIAYLPDRNVFNKEQKVKNIIKFLADFYENFNTEKAYDLIKKLNLDENSKISEMSKGMIERLNIALVMSRDASLYILDEPLGGIDPATRENIIETIITNFNENSSLIISTHLISDIEKILDEILFIDNGKIVLTSSADELREKEKCSIDEVFRRWFKC